MSIRKSGKSAVLFLTLSGLIVLAASWPTYGFAQTKNPIPDHTKHAADPAADKDLANQIAELRGQVAKLEAALTKVAPPAAMAGMGASGSTTAGGMGVKTAENGAGQSGRVATKYQNCFDCHQTRPSGALPMSHMDLAVGAASPPATVPGMAPSAGNSGMAGMGGKPASGMGMMGGMGGAKKGMGGGGMSGMMDGMMGGMGGAKKGMGGGGMMDGMMGGMGDKMKPPTAMAGDSMSGMGDGTSSGMGGMKMMEDDMDMMGMMGMGSMGASAPKNMKGMGSMKMAAALPGFPGASHIYHIGSTGFFLNHPEHITLTAKQQSTLSRLKQKAVLEKSTIQRKIDEADQELWELTGSDEPDASQIQTKIQTIEKLRGEQRMAFIKAVGEAAKSLTDEQRQALLGTMTAEAPKATAPAPASK